MKKLTKEEFDEFVKKVEMHFPNLDWLKDVELGEGNGYITTAEGIVPYFSVYSSPGMEICGVCGCGRSQEVQNLYRKALRAIKKDMEKVRSQSLEGKLKDWSSKQEKILKAFVGHEDVSEKREIDKINPTIFKFCDDPMLEEVILHALDHLGYTQHGASIYGCWLTEHGEVALQLLDWQFGGVKWANEGEKEEA